MFESDDYKTEREKQAAIRKHAQAVAMQKNMKTHQARLREAARAKAKADAEKNKEHAKARMPVSLPKTTDIKKLSQAVERDIFETYYVLMKSPQTPPAVKKACADALADRARGKPEQAVSQKVTVERSDASIADVARMAAFALRYEQEKGENLLSSDSEEIIDLTSEKVDNEPVTSDD